MAYGTVTVGNTATLIRPSNTNRRELRLVNTSAVQALYLGQDSSVTIATGFPLYEYQNMLQSKDNGIWLGEIYGIVSAGNNDLRFWESEGS